MNEEAKRYHRTKQLILLGDLWLQFLFLVLVQISGLSAALNTWVLNASANRLFQIPLFMTAFYLAFYLISFPLHFYSSFALEKKFNLSNLRLNGWLLDELKRVLLSFIFFISTMAALYLLLEHFPRNWWLLAGTGWLFLTLFLTRILPTILIPIFYPTQTLPDGELKRKILRLCHVCGVKILGIYEIVLSKKTKKANAALVGIGKSRRVLLADTLLQNFTLPEIEMVVAHELGHHVKKHIVKSIFIHSLVTFGGFYLLFMMSNIIVKFFHAQSLADLSLFPALALLALLGGLLILPVQNGYSRHLERQADQFALNCYPSKEIFCSMMTKLGTQNLADPSPNPVVEFILYDHPSIARRIEYANKIMYTK